MELKDFVKTVIRDVVTAVEESEKELSRTMQIKNNAENNRAMEFEVAVTSEGSGTGKLGIKVLEFIQIGEAKASYTDASVSKVKFGVYISPKNKDEETKHRKGISELT